MTNLNGGVCDNDELNTSILHHTYIMVYWGLAAKDWIGHAYTNSYFIHVPSVLLPSVLWRCWLGSRKGIRPVKTEWWGTGIVICLKWRADLHMAQLVPLPLTVSCFSKIQIGFTFLVLAHPDSPGKRAIKRVYVCMYVQCAEINKKRATENWLTWQEWWPQHHWGHSHQRPMHRGQHRHWDH